MAEESTTPDLDESVRRLSEALDRRDFRAYAANYAQDAVWDNSPSGLGIFEGREAILRWIEDWHAMFDEVKIDLGDRLDLGNGVTLVAYSQEGRPHGSTGNVQARSVAVSVWDKGLITRTTIYPDIDEARVAAERLAQERE